MVSTRQAADDAERHPQPPLVPPCEQGGTREAVDAAAESNLALTYERLGRHEQAMCMQRDVYSGYLKLHGEENERTLITAINYATSLTDRKRFEEAKALLRKNMPVTRRVLGESHHLTLRMRTIYASALYMDSGATLGDLREAVTTLEDVEQIARRVLGGAHPLAKAIEECLRLMQGGLRSALAS